jgi:hypothetical protein
MMPFVKISRQTFLTAVIFFTETELFAGLALLESGRPFELSTDALLSLALDGAVSVVGSIFIFLPSAIALDYCFKMRFLSPFPTRKQ